MSQACGLGGTRLNITIQSGLGLPDLHRGNDTSRRPDFRMPPTSLKKDVAYNRIDALALFHSGI